jgi:hypothetical protein
MHNYIPSKDGVFFFQFSCYSTRWSIFFSMQEEEEEERMECTSQLISLCISQPTPP